MYCRDSRAAKAEVFMIKSEKKTFREKKVRHGFFHNKQKYFLEGKSTNLFNT
jgi:hypothetical protein